MNVEEVPVGELTEHPVNPRQGDCGAIIESVKANGWASVIVAQTSTRHVLAGNHRLRAARELGMESVPVFWVDVDDETAVRILLADNRTSDVATWDDSALAALLTDLAQQTEKGLVGTGWDGADLDALLAGILKANGTGNVDPGPGEPPKTPIAKPGDLWVLGEHRLLCGDSTERGGVERLMGDDHPTTVFADPPYGIAYKAMRGGKAIANDASAVDALAITKGALSAVSADEWFVCCDWRSLGVMAAALEATGVQPKACIVWDKASRVQNLDRFAKQHEMILYAGPYGGEPTVDVDVWVIARDFEPDHPTPKPVALVERALKVSSGTVYDPFGGSGSTLIAAESLGRKARLIEIDPGYCDVIVKRWETYTGRKAERA